MMMRFWWGHKENQHRVPWLSWERMGLSKDQGGLGFRDIGCFNKALLTKQGWRLVQQPESLVAQIMMAKYYPHGSFLQSRLGNNPSYAWRSLWNSKELLQSGLIWRVGDGKSINIWGDRWLPTPSSYLVQSPVSILTHDAKVNSLIDVNSQWWDVGLVREIFMQEEAETICNMVVCPARMADRLEWVGTRDGNFTVRSAYHLARTLLERDRGASSTNVSLVELWRTVWSLQVPWIVQVFLWKACHDILPTKRNLLFRHIMPKALCPLC